MSPFAMGFVFTVVVYWVGFYMGRRSTRVKP